MEKYFLKACSMLLVIVLLVNMLPMSIFAEEFQASLTDTEATTENTITEETTTEEIASEDAYVVSEITKKRTEYSKEFLLSNGLHMATVYADAVHYETENGWEEIDNTLKTNADGTYSNTAGVWDVTFPQRMGEDESITIEKDGYTISFSMSGELTAGGAMIMSAGLDDAPMQSFAVTDAQTATGEIQQIDTSTMAQAADFPETVPDKLQSQIAYADVYQNTDIIYDLDSNKVKESMILESYNADLQGYSYTLEVGTMIPVLGEDGSVTLYDENQENIVMVMPAPYLIDDAGEHNFDIEVQLISSGSTYTLIYLLPQDWLAAEGRAWPVLLDPVVEADLSTSNIRDRTVAQKKTYAQTWGMNSCGYDTDTGIMRFYLKYNALPALTSSDVVVGATVQMYKAYESSTVTPVYVHKVNSEWDSSTITWANAPSFNGTAEDYAIVDDVKWYGWEITDIVRDWYSNKNTGMVFKASSAIETGGTANFKQFLSSDFGTENSRPVLSIYFRNNNGLESYWDYTSSSAGRAGTGYVNNYTGNLTWVREDIGISGNRMPVSISHIYNLNDASVPSDSNNSNDSGGNGFGMGIGWRTNFNQLVYQWNINSNYYVWEDSDGTDHYFKHESGSTYKDEDGLELTLTINGSGTQKYCITDKNGNCSYFDTYGRLSKISNNQQTKSSINITYYSTSRLITCITDGIGRRYLYMYNNGMLNRIDYMGSGSTVLSYVEYSYAYENNKYYLETIKYKDGKVCIYDYNEKGLLLSAQDIDGYKLNYSYNTPSQTWQPYRVKSVAESDGSALGGSLTFSYAHNQTTITDYNGNTEIYQFNDFGNTVSIQDDEGHAAFAQFSRTDKDDTSGKANQLKVASKLQNTVGNLLPHSSFETGHYWAPNSSSLTVGRTTEASYHGNYSLKLTSTTTSLVAAVRSSYTVAPGETYNFSAYVKSVDASGLIALYCNGTVKPGGHFSAGQDWKQIQITYTNSTSASVTVSCCLFTNSVGTAYMDCVQFEQASTASRFNLVENSNFFYSGSPANSWTGTGLATTDTIIPTETAVPQLGTHALRITGNPTGYKQAIQYIHSSGSAGDSYVFSGWAKGNSVPIPEASTRSFNLTLAFNNTDGTSTKFYANFNPDSDQWQYTASAAVADKAYSSITFLITYNFNANTVYFDGIQLYKEEFGNSYTYDSKGNVISVKDLQAQTTTYEYDTNSNLTKIIQNGSAKMTYTYDNWHNVKTATTDEGLKYDFVYDVYGNNTKVSTTTGGVTMESSAAYTSNGNYLASTTDALGKVTTYGYNLQTGALDWVQYPEDTAATRTEYTYDSMYRMATAACTTDTGLNLSAEYTYTDDLLTKIETPSTTYNFTYGDFDLRTGVSIGSRTLATYHYTDETVNDRKYDLDRLDYGNGDKVQYEYDDKGRVTKQTYEDGAYVTYSYDNDGALAKVYDSQSGITTKYFYDLTGRQMKYTESGTGYSHSVGYTYDTQNNLTKEVQTINGTTSTTTYTYDDDNRVKSKQTGNTKVTYTYDGFGRVSQQVTTNGTTTVLTESFTYNGNSSQIRTYATTAGGITKSYTYTYDSNGNITSINDGAYTITYYYDSANQLIREDNQAETCTEYWTYDNAGNVLGFGYSPYGEDASAIRYRVGFTYTDDDWGDLQTSCTTPYSSNHVTYDGVGNPLTDGIWTYTWQHGRQLMTMANGTETWHYTYHSDGLRTCRSNGTRNYQYIYNGSQLTGMTVGSNILYFSYDASGVPMSIHYNGTEYFYTSNIQGDVTGIVDSSGASVVAYAYDAWGNSLHITGAMASTLGQLNPLRYRGYVFDIETGLYYLQSRYYNPQTGRFINADIYAATGQGFIGNNMFAYCLDNPVNMVDISGTYPVYIVKRIETKINNGTYTTTITYIQYDSNDLLGYFYAPSISVDFRYTISNTGKIQMSNKDNTMLFLHNTTILNALSGEMQNQAKKVKENAQKGRTNSGMSFEIVVHSLLHFLGFFTKNAEPIDMGSSNKGNADYDYNADWFENPWKNIKNIFETLLGG